MNENKKKQLEFIAIMASLMAISALAIDAILPALDVIGISIRSNSITDNQLLVTMFFLGLGVGPLLFGPISDSLGRKPIVYIGIVLFIIASLICIYAPNIEIMIFGRILQGVALSAPRTISVAMIRDLYSGNYMARIMSFVTVVFLLVPIIAPLLGKSILDYFESWRAIFYAQVVFSLFTLVWFWKRQPETLSVTNRIPFKSNIFLDGFKEILKHKDTVWYTIVLGFITGSFMVYLSSAQQIFEIQYDLKQEFPYIFALLSISIGAAILLNGNLVLKYGMKKLTDLSLLLYFVSSILYIVLYYNSTNPHVAILLSFFAVQFFAVGFLFANLRAIVMDPIGHIAGIGAAISGFVSTLMAVVISTYIGTFVKDTTLPLFIGFLICSFISIVIIKMLRQKKI